MQSFGLSPEISLPGDFSFKTGYYNYADEDKYYYVVYELTDTLENVKTKVVDLMKAFYASGATRNVEDPTVNTTSFEDENVFKDASDMGIISFMGAVNEEGDAVSIMAMIAQTEQNCWTVSFAFSNGEGTQE